MNKFLTIVFFGFLAAVGRSESPSDYYYDPNAENIKSGAYMIVKGKKYSFEPPETPEYSIGCKTQ